MRKANPLSTENTRNLPHADLHASRGAVFTQEAGWRVPEHYGDPSAELAAARGEAGQAGQAGEVRRTPGSGAVCDISNHGVLEFLGGEARGFLHRVLTQSIEGLAPASWALTAATDHKGRLLAAGPLLCRNPDRFLWLLQPGAVSPTLETMNRYAVLDDVEVRDATSEFCAVAIHAGELRAGPEDSWTVPVTPSEVWALSEASREPSLWEELIETHRPIGRWVREIRRIETGRPAWGREITPQHTPWDLGLTSYVSLEKGCYTGQETLNRLQTYGGVKKELVRLVFDGGPSDGIPGTGEDIGTDGSDRVGTITSCEALPEGGGVALAVVDKSALRPGDSVGWSAGTGRVAGIGPA